MNPRSFPFLPLGLLLPVLLGACTPAPAAPAPGAVATTAPAIPQTLTIGTPTLLATLDSAVTVNGSVRKYDLFETLTTYDDKGGVQPLLATQWATTGPTTWNFTIRSDAKFHDGTPVTAKDVEFSWNRAQDPALKAQVPGNMSTVATVMASDLNTVAVTTKVPDPILPRRFYYLAIVPQSALQRLGEQAFWQNPIGSGPFRFKEFKADDHLTITGWMEHAYRKPKLTQITVQAVPDTSARVGGLRTGSLDMINSTPLEGISSLSRDGFQIFKGDTTNMNIWFDSWATNGTDAGPIANKLVRQALNYAIDRDSIAKNLWQGLARPTGTPLTEGVVGFDPALVPYKYDQAKAKQLLAQAGYANGFAVKAEFLAVQPEIQTTMLAIQSQLKEVGVAIELVQLDNATWVSHIYKRTPAAPLFETITNPAPLFDGDQQFAFYWSENQGFGKRYVNADFDAKYVAQRQELDPAKREALMRDLSRISQEDPTKIAVISVPLVTGYAKTVAIPSFSAEGIPYYETVSRTAS